MTPEKLTEEFMKMVGAMARIESYTSCIPQLRTDVDRMCIDIHDNNQHRAIVEQKLPDIDDNTKFRKNAIKIIWISVSAAVAGISGLIISLISLANKGGI